MLEAHFTSFFIILLVAVFFSAVFARLHLPWAVALIVGGMVIGPHGFDFFKPNETILFLSEIGLIFLMFMAGLEVRFESFKKRASSISSIAFINGFLPFLAGLGIGLLLDLPLMTALLLGIIFISSSIAVVVPSLEANKLIGTKLGDAIVGSTMLQDIASLVLLSVFFQTSEDLSSIPLPIFYLLLLGFLVFLRKILPRIEKLFAQGGVFQQELRSVFLVLLGTVVVFELLDLHPIIAGFFAGLVLSDRVNAVKIKEKLRAISYGLFIPIFFVVIGMQSNLGVFRSATGVLVAVLVITLGSIVSKVVSGWIGARLMSFTKKEAALVAVTSVPQLSTTLAVAFSSYALGLIDEAFVTSLVILSIVTTLLAPLVTNFLLKSFTPESVEEELKTV